MNTENNKPGFFKRVWNGVTGFFKRLYSKIECKLENEGVLKPIVRTLVTALIFPLFATVIGAPNAFVVFIAFIFFTLYFKTIFFIGSFLTDELYRLFSKV